MSDSDSDSAVPLRLRLAKRNITYNEMLKPNEQAAGVKTSPSHKRKRQADHGEEKGNKKTKVTGRGSKRGTKEEAKVDLLEELINKAYFDEEEPNAVGFVKGFQVQSRQDIEDAIIRGPRGSKFKFVRPVDESAHAWFQYDPSLFPPIPEPQCEDDWLASYLEEGQTFAEFMQDSCLRSGSFKPAIRPKKNTIYLQPIGNFLEEEVAKVTADELISYTKAFYDGCEVCLLPNVVLVEELQRSKECIFWQEQGSSHKFKLKARHNEETGRRQLHVDPILSALSGQFESHTFKADHPDAFCIMAITMEDLYSADSDLFVAGMAAGGSGVAAFSFARYVPGYRFSREFWWKWYDLKDNVVMGPLTTKSKGKGKSRGKGKGRGKGEVFSAGFLKTTFLRRCLRLLVHELGHLFIVGHCILCECCMNGSGHLEEDFRQPMHLCPNDLKKFCYRFGVQFNPSRRYQRLLSYYQLHGFKEESEWVSKRIEYATGQHIQTPASLLSPSPPTRRSTRKGNAQN